MADKKITQLTNITGANLVDADEFVVVDISADETKAITLGELKEAFDAGSGFVRVTGDTMTGALDVQSTITADGLTVGGINSSGNVGIGTSSPIYPLHVQGEAGIELYNVTGGGSVLNFRPSLGDSDKYNLSISSYDHNGGGVGPADGLSINGFDGVSFTTGSSNARQERMRIDSAGNVGIGTTAPSEPLDVAGGKVRIGNTKIGQSGAGGAWDMTFETYSGGYYERMRINSSGHLLIGTSNAVGTADTSGLRKGGTGQLILGSNSGGLLHQVLSDYYTVTTSGGSTSDATLKKNVTPLTGALERVCNLRGVNFEFKAAQKSDPDNGVQLGVIAQEVEVQYSEAVVTNSDGIKSVRYDRLVAPLIEAIKEQKAIIDALETRITALEG